MYEKDYLWHVATCSYKNGKYLASIIDDDEIIEETKTIPTGFNEKKVTSKTQNFYILLLFLSIAILLLIAVGIYRYLIKYKSKKKNIYYHFMSQITN